MAAAKATLHGAISIVSAIAMGKGATLGISLKTEATIKTSQGKGVILVSDNKTISSRLVNKVVQKVVPKKVLDKNKLKISIRSEIPTGYGLKSSSAISSAVSLACAKLFRPKWSDYEILIAGVNASIETKVSITGAYDDACGCYYGGFVVTDNYKRKIIKSEKGPQNLTSVIFIPKSRKRGKVKNLKKLSIVFDQAWRMARNSDYWNAMILNGLATSSILNSDVSGWVVPGSGISKPSEEPSVELDSISSMFFRSAFSDSTTSMASKIKMVVECNFSSHITSTISDFSIGFRNFISNVAIFLIPFSSSVRLMYSKNPFSSFISN